MIFIDPNWITTSTAFTLFKPSSGQSTFSGLGRVTNVDYENQLITATAWVIGLPRGPFDVILENSNDQLKTTRIVDFPEKEPVSLDDMVDMHEAKLRQTYFSPPPDICDFCRRSFANEKYMIDGSVKGARYWACMCSECFSTNGKGIGWGIGQLYLHDSKGWLEVSGFSKNSLNEM